MKIPNVIKLTIDQFKNESFFLFILNSLVIIFQVFYISMRFKYINSVIPFWYTNPWGDYQLAPKNNLYLISIFSSAILITGVVFIFINRFYIRYFKEFVWFFVGICNLWLTASIYRIIAVASIPFDPLISPIYLKLLLPFILSFIITYLFLPYFIDYAHSKKLVTDPSLHSHPAMVLKSVSARGGGFIYGLIFLVISFILVGFKKEFSGLYLSVIMVSVLGLIDDIQNTRPFSSLKMFENPLLRLYLLFLSVFPSVISGTIIHFAGTTFGNFLKIDSYTFSLGALTLPVVSAILTVLWIVWVMNVLSWSNGIDGQFCGIVGISSIIIALLALRFTPVEDINLQYAFLAAISAGVAFGFTKYTWHPSKIMWGFGAMSAGLVISVLSISVKGKIITSVLIILIPFLDALVTAIRRVAQGKLPWMGDKGHLHHLLLDRGWSPQQIARFYWITTVAFGCIGLLFPEKYSLQVFLIIAGMVAFSIVILNLLSLKDKTRLQTIGK